MVYNDLQKIMANGDSYLSVGIAFSIGYVLKLKKYPQMYPLQGEARNML